MKKKAEEEEEDEMIYVDGKLVKKEKVELPPKMRTKKLKQGKRESSIAEEALGLLIRLCYVDTEARDQIAENGGITATCALLKVAGPNKPIHKSAVLLLGMLGASSSLCRDYIFEEEAGSLICASMKRYGSDHDIVMYGCWAIAAACFSHGSNQTIFAMGSGLDATRKAKSKFKSKSNETHAEVRAWADVA